MSSMGFSGGRVFEMDSAVVLVGSRTSQFSKLLREVSGPPLKFDMEADFLSHWKRRFRLDIHE